MNIELVNSISKHFGITVSTEDAPKIVLAIQNAYAVGKTDEREACAQVCEAEAVKYEKRNLLGFAAVLVDDAAAAIRARGAP